ncbi:Crp/Fnr family transcriptional regulator [Rubripirellula reticaptiva]|uniref:cAMP receptor protein n=1 Tax=Rubripirellula reticaptiva TaxID=2528013 RepID=A0A5C6EK14_9BACT|nr:cyclic nucleotide-binding domain-containing protein [Rubripirellula reticaptiva]TWU49158.1 cAMP receptor protein [Rubripirellula reticaptiva]
MVDAKIELLRRMPAFGGLKPPVIDWIYCQSSVIAATAGEYFFREGEPGESLFVLQSGTVLVTRQCLSESIELGRLREGDCFGEMALIDFRPRSATIIAETDCQAIKVPRQSLASLYQQDVEQYAIIMMNLGREVSRRLRMADDCLFHLQHRGLIPTV